MIMIMSTNKRSYTVDHFLVLGIITSLRAGISDSFFTAFPPLCICREGGCWMLVGKKISLCAYVVCAIICYTIYVLGVCDMIYDIV
jgi:hypothetical protein